MTLPEIIENDVSTSQFWRAIFQIVENESLDSYAVTCDDLDNLYWPVLILEEKVSPFTNLTWITHCVWFRGIVVLLMLLYIGSLPSVAGDIYTTSQITCSSALLSLNDHSLRLEHLMLQKDWWVRLPFLLGLSWGYSGLKCWNLSKNSTEELCIKLVLLHRTS